MSDPLYLIFGTTETGVWCDRCNLPSAIEVRVNSVNSEGVGDGYLTICPDCDERNKCNERNRP